MKTKESIFHKNDNIMVNITMAKISEQLFRICWSMPNGYKGHCEFCLTTEEATIWLSSLCKTYPNMSHWSEKQQV
jgi:hypothetical protein